jgi:hypothetical protein
LNEDLAAPLSKEQLWDDLGTLAWIVESRPTTARSQLRELEQRSPQAQGGDLRRRLYQQTLRLLAVWQ